MNSLQEYTSFTLETISIDLLPKEALEKFEGYSKRFILPKEYVSGNFEWFWKAELKNGIVYIAKQRKPQNTEHVCYVYQFDTQSNPLWYAEIWELSEKHNPYTWLYFIWAIQKKKWYAKNMLPFLWSLSEYFFNKPLNSTKTFIGQEDPITRETVPVIQKVYEWFEEDGLTVRQDDWTFNFVKEKLQQILVI